MWKFLRIQLIFLLWMLQYRFVTSLTSSILCARIPGLSPIQRQLCTESPDAMVALGAGHLLAAQECQHQFKGYRWNCSQVWQKEIFGHVMFVGSREAAFTYAIASAGAVHAITAACARGNISLCGCDTMQRNLQPYSLNTYHHHHHQLHHHYLQNQEFQQQHQQLYHDQEHLQSQYELEQYNKNDYSSIIDSSSSSSYSSSSSNIMSSNSYPQINQPWKWGGCSADIHFGMKFARKFLDAREIEGDARSLMNLHNNRAGRKIVKNLLRTECKCHGVSGSCAMKTCWKSLPPFRVIGDALMKKYNRAKFVQPEQDKSGLTLILSKKGRITKNLKKLQRPKRMELVYIQHSPNYCEKDLLFGSLGTVGRNCNRTTNGVEGCDLLCCGRGYNTHQINKTWQCRCKFHWCCQVQCEICNERLEEYTCK